MRQRGVALLVVMWLLVLLASIVGLFALNAHVEALQASAQRQRLALEAAAEAGLEAAAARLLAVDPARRPIPDGRPTRLDLGDGITVDVAITDESGKVDLNVADVTLLARLGEQAGLPAPEAAAVAAAIVDWRDADSLVGPSGGAEAGEYRAAGLPYGPANRAFAQVPEVQRVLGLRPGAYRAMRPYLTVYTGLAQPNLAFADRPVLLAMGLAPPLVDQVLAARAAMQPGLPPPALPGGLVLAATGTGPYSISSRAARADGPRAELEATGRVGAGGFLGQVNTPLSWRHGQQD
ncbi:MAG: general secretion pathway protein GspK [Lysobacteraceae bacterium]